MAHLIRRLVAVGAASALLWPVLLDAQARERVAFVSVVDTSHRPAGRPSSAPADIVVREDGVRARGAARGPGHRADAHRAAGRQQRRRRTGHPRHPRRRHRLLAALGDLGPVALVTMADRPTLITDYTSIPPCSRPASTRIFARPGSGVTLLDAVLEASRRAAASREGERAAIVLLSAQGIEHSTLHYTRPLGRLKQSGADAPRRRLSIRPAAPRSPMPRGSATRCSTAASRETGGVRRDVLTQHGLR